MSQMEISLKSRIMTTYMSVFVQLPDVPAGVKPADFYEPGKKYPVLWLLHGSMNDHNMFVQDCRLRKNLKGRPVIVIMPDAMNSDYTNHMEFGSGYPFTDFFFEELMPFVYATLPASEKREDNYISGCSMGGAGSLMFGLLHPECFAAVAPLSCSAREADFLTPYLDLTGPEFRAMATADPKKFPTEYGVPEDGISFKEINMISRYNTVRNYVNSMECTADRLRERLMDGTVPEIFFCCGADDKSCAEKVPKVVELAESLGSDKVTCKVLPGCGHKDVEPVVVAMLEHFGF